MRTTRHSSVGGNGWAPTHQPAKSPHHTTAPAAQQATKPSRLHPPSHIPRVMRIRITCLCALTEWHTWIGLVDVELEKRGLKADLPHSPLPIPQCCSGFESVISFPHTAFTDEPKCISLLTVVANLRWVFHSQQIAPARIKCAHTNRPRTCKKPNCVYNKSGSVISTRGRCAIISLNYLNRTSRIR